MPESVDVLLSASCKAHEAYRRASGRIDPKGHTIPGDDGLCRDAIGQAYSLRTKAHGLDPHHQDPAWTIDRTSHDALMQFYRDYLA